MPSAYALQKPKGYSLSSPRGELKDLPFSCQRFPFLVWFARPLTDPSSLADVPYLPQELRPVGEEGLHFPPIRPYKHAGTVMDGDATLKLTQPLPRVKGPCNRVLRVFQGEPISPHHSALSAHISAILVSSSTRFLCLVLSPFIHWGSPLGIRDS